MTDTVCPLRAVSNWPITVAKVYVSLTLLFHTTESHNVPKSIWSCYSVYRSNLYYSLLSIKKIKKIFNIYTGIHKIFMHKSEESCPGLEKSRVSIFIIDLRPPRVSYLALTRSGLKCGSSFSWQLSKIDFQNLVVKRSMKVSIEENHRPKDIHPSLLIQSNGHLLNASLMNLYVCKYVYVPIFVLAE